MININRLSFQVIVIENASFIVFMTTYIDLSKINEIIHVKTKIFL